MTDTSGSLSPTSARHRRKTSTRKRAPSYVPHAHKADLHESALQSIRAFLKGRISYDAFPVSFRLIVLDTKLEVKNALQCLLMNGVVSAALWNSETCRFAGMLTLSDIIHLIQYYYYTSTYDNATSEIETLRLEALRDIEKKLGVAQPPLTSITPNRPLYEAAKQLIQTHARRLPLLDYDDETRHEVVVSVLTQYRLLKFIAINCKEIQHLAMSLRSLGIGTYVSNAAGTTSEGQLSNPYHPIATATMSTRVFDVVHMFSQRGISAVPIVDDEGVVQNLYETVDVMTLVKGGSYPSLDFTIADALNQRSPDFPGVVICAASDSLGTFLSLIQKRRVHRIVVVEGEAEEKVGGKRGRLLGIITLSDVLRYIVGKVGIDETSEIPEEDTTPRTPK